jgi:phosphate transporter family protein
MDAGDVIVGLVVAAALGFDLTNGFHDTATTIATGALKPKVAVTIAASLNFVGAFISLKVAATVAGGIVDAGAIPPTVVFGGLIGAICWNLATWWFGLPSSSSHALIGGVVGSTIAAAGSGAVKFDGLLSNVIIPAIASPVVAGIVAAIGVFLVYRMIRRYSTDRSEREFRWGQVGSSSMVALAHGTNDAQKVMSGGRRMASARARRRRALRGGRWRPAIRQRYPVLLQRCAELLELRRLAAIAVRTLRVGGRLPVRARAVREGDALLLDARPDLRVAQEAAWASRALLCAGGGCARGGAPAAAGDGERRGEKGEASQAGRQGTRALEEQSKEIRERVSRRRARRTSSR